MPSTKNARKNEQSDSGKRGRRNQRTQNNATLTNTEKTALEPRKSKRAVGLLVTGELEAAIEQCRCKVQAIAKDCRARNRKHRDIDWDIDNDRNLCLHGLVSPEESLNPGDVMRITDLFDSPAFFKDGASSSDIEQGALDDCWFLSALATVATVPHLLDRICVERDELVGVYGFVFFRDGYWTDVIIDDLVFVTNPKFAELTSEGQKLYHYDQEVYNNIARKGRKSLFFARSMQEGETWVPLIEKAYAKLHGDYASLSRGKAREATEDLTGGVCSEIPIIDILDPQRLWTELLAHPLQHHLFGCFLPIIKTACSCIRVHGLIPEHTYSILKTIEYNGKKFLVIRNPWGEAEWTGPWSDGSKEWTAEWLPLLETLNYQPGNDGMFIMEYGDFLKHWGSIESTRLFDSSWRTSSLWLELKRGDRPFSYGDVSFTFSLPASSPAVIVLQQLDTRYFRGMAGARTWQFDFVVFKRGQKEPVASSVKTSFWCRSVSLEVPLEAGEYVVHVRLDALIAQAEEPEQTEGLEEEEDGSEKSKPVNNRKIEQVAVAHATAQSIAINFRPLEHTNSLPLPLSIFAGHDLTELEMNTIKDKSDAEEKRKALLEVGSKAQEPQEPQEAQEEEGANDVEKDGDEGNADEDVQAENANISDDQVTHVWVRCDGCKMSPLVGVRYKCLDAECPDYDLCSGCMEKGVHPAEHRMLRIENPEQAEPLNDEDGGVPLTLGLRVYSKRHAPTKVNGQLRHGQSNIKWTKA